MIFIQLFIEFFYSISFDFYSVSIQFRLVKCFFGDQPLVKFSS